MRPKRTVTVCPATSATETEYLGPGYECIFVAECSYYLLIGVCKYLTACTELDNGTMPKVCFRVLEYFVI